MVGKSIPILPTMLPPQCISPKSPFIALNTSFPSKIKHPIPFIVKSSSSQDTQNTQQPSSSSSSSSDSKNPLAVVLDVPRNIWKQTLRPLSDFGFGTRSIWEGGVGLFLVSGTVLLAVSLVWLRAFQLKSRFRKYLAVFEFSQACGISTGTQVRIRGVTVGNVIRVNPSLKSIEAVVEVNLQRLFYLILRF